MSKKTREGKENAVYTCNCCYSVQKYMYCSQTEADDAKLSRGRYVGPVETRGEMKRKQKASRK